MSGISDVVVGLDVGTSSIKALALTDRGGVFGPVRVATPTTRYPDGTAEHDPADLWDAVTGCLHALTRFLPDGVRVGALATATVGEAIVPVNDAGAELRPMIAWYDQRGAAYLARWRHDPGTRAVYQITGQTADESLEALTEAHAQERPCRPTRSPTWPTELPGSEEKGRGAMTSALPSPLVLHGQHVGPRRRME